MRQTKIKNNKSSWRDLWTDNLTLLNLREREICEQYLKENPEFKKWLDKIMKEDGELFKRLAEI